MSGFATTVHVEAWQYPGGGYDALPEPCRDAFFAQGIEVRHHTEPYHMNQMMRDAMSDYCDVPEEGSPQDYLAWHSFDPWMQFECSAGDWITQDDDGLLRAVDADYFMAEYTPCDIRADVAHTLEVTSLSEAGGEGEGDDGNSIGTG